MEIQINCNGVTRTLTPELSYRLRKMFGENDNDLERGIVSILDRAVGDPKNRVFFEAINASTASIVDAMEA